MAIPRRDLIDESSSSIYHCMSRTVRQELLLSRHTSEFGPDGSRVVDDHRREWILSRLEELATAFAIDCFSLAVMSNHFHTALRNLPELVEHWSDAEVVYRWLLLHRPKTTRKRLGIPADSPPTKIELLRFLANPWEVARLRTRMSSISWYMKELKEPLARRANREDGCTGAFWEERFKSIRVLDEDALTAVAAYIDLNPVRAGMVDDPVKARFSSLEAMLRRMKQEAHERSGEALDASQEAAQADSDSASSAMQRKGLNFWRRLAAAADADGTIDSEADLEAFIAQFDTALFTPALPARREAYGIADAWLAEEPDTGDASSSDVAADAHSHPTPPPRVPRHPPRPVPSLTPLPFSMGAYLRRLRILAELERTGSFPPAGRRRPRAGDVIAIESLAVALTGLANDAAITALGVMLRTTRQLGTAIGTAANVAAEAARRGRTRVVPVNRCDGHRPRIAE